MKGKMLIIISLMLSIVVLAGCAGSSNAPTPEPTPASTPAPDTGNNATETPSDADAANSSSEFHVAAVLGLGGLGDGSLSDAIYSGLAQARDQYGVNIQVIEPREIAEF